MSKCQSIRISDFLDTLIPFALYDLRIGDKMLRWNSWVIKAIISAWILFVYFSFYRELFKNWEIISKLLGKII